MDALVKQARTGQTLITMNSKRLPHLACAASLLIVALLPCAAFGQPVEPAAEQAGTNGVRVLVAYDSLTGNTEKMAEGVVAGAKQVSGAVVVLKSVDKVTKEDLETADGIILGCPTYYGTIPGRMKVVIDDWSWKLKVDFTDKVGGAFSTGGGQAGGKEFVVVSLLMFMLNNRMVVAGPLYQNDKTGSVWAEVGAAAMTGPLDAGVSEGELDSARRLGERVARLAVKMKRAEAAPREAR
jgi:NAD(P)H dehydrogenase (quinone)